MHAAILKVSAGDLTKLQSLTKAAGEDYRDLLAAAEYPGYSQMGFNALDRPPREIRRVKAEDWYPYLNQRDNKNQFHRIPAY